jgi:hypothetical protein
MHALLVQPASGGNNALPRTQLIVVQGSKR